MQTQLHSSAQGRDRPGSRLPELDGFRALAVLGVLLFHYLQRYGDYYPYGSRFLPAAQVGWLGVDLFFIISGFVITLTLHQTRSPLDFILRRMARLLPAMLICATLTFLLLRVVDTPFTRTHRVGVDGFLPSLTFTDPWLWQWLVPGVDYIDGAYWSLFVEIRFYFWAAVVYFLAGPRRFLPIFTIGSLVILASYAAMGDTSLKLAEFLLFFPHYLPLFCTGMIAHSLYCGAPRTTTIAGFMLFGGLSIWSVHGDGPVPMAVMAGILLLFVALIWRRAWLAPFAHPAVTMLGACSYSLYLIHQNVGVALITLLPRSQSSAFYVAAVLAIALGMIAFSIFLFRLVEQPLQKRARAWIARSSARVTSTIAVAPH